MGGCWNKFYDGLWERLVYRVATVIVAIIILGAFGHFPRKSAKPIEIGPIDLKWETYLSCETPNGVKGVCLAPIFCQNSVKTLYQVHCAPNTFCCADEYGSGVKEMCTSPKDPGCRSKQNAISGDQTPTSAEPLCKMSFAPPDPASKCCGVETESNEITGGSTSMDHYPWTAALVYEKNGVNKVRCAGSLISGRYVLTAAQCMLNDTWTLKNVRLGNYNISNPGKDCAEDVETGNYGCTESEVVPVEEIISHQRGAAVSEPHDIALIRLARVVNYTDFIRPICLPSVDFTEAATIDDVLYAAGRVISYPVDVGVKTSTDIRPTFELPYVSLQECQSAFKLPEIELGNGQICAGGVEKNSCMGDAGGPLMKSNGNFMELVGIDSFILDGCSKAKSPNVYTKVYTYLSWIRSHIVE